MLKRIITGIMIPIILILISLGIIISFIYCLLTYFVVFAIKGIRFMDYFKNISEIVLYPVGALIDLIDLIDE